MIATAWLFNDLQKRHTVHKDTHFSIHVWHTSKSEWGQITVTEAVLSYNNAVSEFSKFLSGMKEDKRFLIAYSVGAKNTAQLLFTFDPPGDNDFAIVAQLRELVKGVQKFKQAWFENDFPTKEVLIKEIKAAEHMIPEQALPRSIIKDWIKINSV